MFGKDLGCLRSKGPHQVLYFQTKKEHKLNLPQSPPTMFTGLASLLSHIKLNYVSRLCFEYVLRPST